MAGHTQHSEPLQLHCRRFGDGGRRPPLVILHGLLASSANWQTVAWQLSDDHLLANLVHRAGKWLWRVNLEAIRRALAVAAPYPSPGAAPCLRPTLFIAGEYSRFFTAADHPAAQRCFPNMDLITIPDAGHRVHVDAPTPFIGAVKGFLQTHGPPLKSGLG